jgi:hypothetical protein
MSQQTEYQSGSYSRYRADTQCRVRYTFDRQIFGSGIVEGRRQDMLSWSRVTRVNQDLHADWLGCRVDSNDHRQVQGSKE